MGAREGGVSAPGFLQRRCYTGVTSPDGFESLGGFARNPDGRWEASIDARDDGSGAGAGVFALDRALYGSHERHRRPVA